MKGAHILIGILVLVGMLYIVYGRRSLYTQQYGTNVPGNTLTSAYGSPSVCERRCNETPGCSGFVYNASGFCDLKSKLNGERTVNAHTVYEK